MADDKSTPWIRDSALVPKVRERLAAHGLELVLNANEEGEVYDLYATENGRIVCTSNDSPEDLLHMLDVIDARGVWWREQGDEYSPREREVNRIIAETKDQPADDDELLKRNLCDRLTADETFLIYSIQAIANAMYRLDVGNGGDVGLAMALKKLADELAGKL